MLLRKVLLASALVSTILGVSAPANAHGDARVNFPPPPLPYELVPSPRHGHVWVPGYWQARAHKHGYRHHWVAGYWLPARVGHHYRQPHWIHRGSYWVQQPGYWDRDGDGIPDRHDRFPNNPYRR
jgi:hypothetical protein